MPNIIDTCVTVRHDDPKTIDRIISAYERGKLIDDFVPKELLPYWNPPNDEEITQRLIERYGAISEHDWRWNIYGTYWEPGDHNAALDSGSPNKIYLYIETPWHPPLFVLDQWVDLGCHVGGTIYGWDDQDALIYHDKYLWKPVYCPETCYQVDIDEAFPDFEDIGELFANLRSRRLQAAAENKLAS